MGKDNLGFEVMAKEWMSIRVTDCPFRCLSDMGYYVSRFGIGVVSNVPSQFAIVARQCLFTYHRSFAIWVKTNSPPIGVEVTAM